MSDSIDFTDIRLALKPHENERHAEKGNLRNIEE